jgi:hypothetical protein
MTAAEPIKADLTASSEQSWSDDSPSLISVMSAVLIALMSITSLSRPSARVSLSFTSSKSIGLVMLPEKPTCWARARPHHLQQRVRTVFRQRQADQNDVRNRATAALHGQRDGRGTFNLPGGVLQAGADLVDDRRLVVHPHDLERIIMAAGFHG